MCLLAWYASAADSTETQEKRRLCSVKVSTNRNNSFAVNMFSNETSSFFNHNSNILAIKCERQVPKIVGKLIEILRRRVEGLSRNRFNSLWITG